MWLSFDEVIALGVAERTLRRRVKKRDWESRETIEPLRNGRRPPQILLSSLPAEIQEKWIQSRSIEPPPDGAPEVDRLDELTDALGKYGADLREAFIAEVLRLDALLDLYEAIDPKRGRDGSGKLDFVGAVKELCKQAVCTNGLILAKEPSRGRVPSPHTLDGWSRERRRNRLLTFLRSKPKPVTDKDGRVAKVTPDAAQWLEGRWKHFPTVSHLYAKWENEATKNGWDIPARSWLYKRFATLPEIVKGAARGTDKTYTDKHKPFLPRTVEGLAALQVVCGDHHVLDLHCWSDRANALVRPWLTAWQCIRTGLIWGWHLDLTPSSFTIGCAYAMGVRNFGAQPPSNPALEFQSFAYTDNGKDYKSRNLSGEIEVHSKAAAIDGGLLLLMTQRGVGLLNESDVEHRLARMFNGREKPIERTFRDLADSVQNDFFKTAWCGRSTKDRPDSWREMYTRHQKAIKAGRPSPFPHETEIHLWMADWVDSYNAASHERTNLGGIKIVPLEEHSRLYTTRYEIRDETLALMAMKATSGTVRKNGITAFGSSYWHPELSKYKGSKDADGKALQLEVRYQDSDYRSVWVVLPDGAICEAQRVEVGAFLKPSKESQKAVAQRIKTERDLRKNYTLLQQSVWRGESVEERVAAEMEIPQPVELPIAVGQNEVGGVSEFGGETQATVHLMGRLDAKRHRAGAPVVTADDVKGMQSDTSIFSAPRVNKRVKLFDFEEDE